MAQLQETHQNQSNSTAIEGFCAGQAEWGPLLYKSLHYTVMSLRPVFTLKSPWREDNTAVFHLYTPPLAPSVQPVCIHVA